MKVGINLNTPKHFPIVKQLIDNGQVDFCELMVDNFLHLNPEQIRKDLGEIPISFHIMNSRFIEAEKACLKQLGSRIREFISAANPFYVSDHLAKFMHKGKYLPRVAELDYALLAPEIIERTNLWQEILGERILLENHASLATGKRDQADFCRELVKKSGCGLLFDISNAVVAELNRAETTETWIELASASEHFHIAGYDKSNTEPVLFIDTHDAPLSSDSLLFSKRIFSKKERKAQTIVIERDENLSVESWLADRAKLEELLCN